MAAGEHHPGLAFQDVGGVVERRGRHHADVADLAAGVGDALDQRLHQFGAGQATVAADRDAGLAAGEAFRADRTADPVGGFAGQGVAHHAADVVGAEDAGGQSGGGDGGIGHGGALLQSQEVLVFVENVDIEDIGVLKQRVDQFTGPDRLGGLLARCGGGLVIAVAVAGGGARQARQALGQLVEFRQAQAEGFDGLSGREFVKHLAELLGVALHRALLAAQQQLQADQRAEQGQQDRRRQQQRRDAVRTQLAAGDETQLPVGVAAVQAQGRARLRRAALGEGLRRVVAELLDQVQLADLGRQRRQAGEQALQVGHQQQGGGDRLVVDAAQWRNAVDQPALADPVGFRRRGLAILDAADQVQRGEVHRRRAAGVLHRLAAQVEAHVDHSAPVAGAALRGADLHVVPALQHLQQPRVAGGGGGVGLQLLQRLLQRGGLVVAPGLGQLLVLLGLLALQAAEPHQRRGGQQAEQAGAEARQQRRQGFPETAGRLRRCGGVDRFRFLGGALEEFHAGAPVFILNAGLSRQWLPE
ncbi:hypothetical protein D9M69_432170 [compost metagenome]